MRVSNSACLLAVAAIGLAAANAWAGTTNEPVTGDFEKQCEGVALAIEKDLAAKGLGFVEKHFDLDACLDRTFKDLNAPPRLEREYRSGGKSGFDEAFSRPLLAATSVRYLRVRRAGKEVRALFRMLPKDGAVDYFEAIFDPARGKSARATDFYIFSAGQTLSDTLRLAVMPGIGEIWRGPLERLNVKESDFEKHFTQLAAIARAAQEQDYRGALTNLAKLPAALQNERIWLSLRVQCAAQLDPKEHQAAIDRWRSVFPDDPSIALTIMNVLLAKGQNDRYFAAMDRLDKQLGGDPYLNVLRARHQQKFGRFEQARSLVLQAVERDPMLAEGYDVLVTLAVREGQFSETARWLDEWERASKSDALPMVESPAFIEFVRSEPGRKWLDAKDVKLAASAKKSPTDPADRAKHKLQGIFYTATKPAAIISGRTVYPGDRLQGGYRVAQISPQNVTLKSAGGDVEVLALE